jgi:hypothetical protein
VKESYLEENIQLLSKIVFIPMKNILQFEDFLAVYTEQP